MPTAKISVREISRRTGYSPATVSNALNNKDGVSHETAAEVRAFAALGADAVCVGRALMPPIQQQGAAGCQRTLEDITAELAAAMARTGSRDVRHIDPSLLWIDGKHLH